MKNPLSQLERVPLHEARKHEANDFTPWLVEEDNLSTLADALGLADLELVATEHVASLEFLNQNTSIEQALGWLASFGHTPLREGVELEYKAAQGTNGQGEVPKDFWPTYSAMANAHGGVFLLGVREKAGVFSVAGLNDPAKVHADYSDRASVRVIRRPSEFEFRNPGALRVPVAQALKGGESDCRNRTLQQMFLMINLGERAGSGLPRILTSWQGEGHKLELKESFEPYDQSVLTMAKGPVKTSEKTSEKMSEKTPAGISRLLRIDPNMTIAGLSAALGKTTRTIERTLATMQAQGTIQRVGGDKGGFWKVLK